MRASKSGEICTPLPTRRVTAEDFRKFTEKSPQSTMSRFQERDILKKLQARGLEKSYPQLLADMIKDTKLHYLTVTHYAGANVKIKGCHPEVRFTILPYKFMGRTERFGEFLRVKRDFQDKWILHYPVIRKIQSMCVLNLPYELTKLNFSKVMKLNELKLTLKDKSQAASQFVYEFYIGILNIVNEEEGKMKQKISPKTYLGACTGLLSLHISRIIAHTLLNVVKTTQSIATKPYLILNITFNTNLVLSPTAEEVFNTISFFLDKIIEIGNEIYVLERNKIKGYENKCIHLCLTEAFIAKCKEDLKSNINKLYIPILRYVEDLNSRFSKIYPDINSEEFFQSISDINFEEGCKRINYYQEYLHKIMFVPDHEFFKIGKMFLSDYREELHKGLKENMDAIFDKLCSQHFWEVNDLYESFALIKMRAAQKPTSTEELMETSKYIAWIKNEHFAELSSRVHDSLSSLCKIIDLGILTDEHILMNSDIIHWLDDILPIIDEHLLNFEQLKFEAEERLQKVVEDVTVLIKDVYPILVILDEMDDLTKVRQYLHAITLHMTKIKDIEGQIAWINKEEVSSGIRDSAVFEPQCIFAHYVLYEQTAVILSFPKSTYSEYEEFKNYVYPFYRLLKLCLDVQRNLSVWQDGSFDRLNYEATQKTAEKFHTELTETYKIYRKKLRQAQDENLPLRFKGTVDDPDILNWPAPLKLCGKAQKLIEEFKPAVTVMRIICNPCLTKRHWDAISEIAGSDVTPNAGTTLKKMMKIDFLSRLEEYEIISSGATKESQLKNRLRQLEDRWEDIHYKLEDHKNMKILTDLEEIDSVVNDQTIEIMNMKVSVFVKPHVGDVSNYIKLLTRIKQTVELWKEVQDYLVQLLPIFSSRDLMKAIPEETKLFHEVRGIYNGLTLLIENEKSVVRVVGDSNITENVEICLTHLESVQRGILLYLESVRDTFSRFYFLSNDELLEALSNTTQAFDSSRFFVKLFPGICKLNASCDEIRGVFNAQTENFNFINSIKRKAPLEDLCALVECEMKNTLRNQLVSCYKTYRKMELEELLAEYPVQLLQVVSQIYFTEVMESALKLTHNIKLRLYLQRIEEIIKEKTDKINEKQIDNVKREKLKILIINDINNKNTIQKIFDSNFVDRTNFVWEATFKYYYRNTICVVKNLNVRLEYSYEYLGNSSPLILTPLTERCYRTILNTFSLHQNALVRGQPDTGKVETMRNLAHTFGLLFVMFNCTKNVDISCVRRLLKGNSRCGSWICLKNLTGLSSGVLSVLYQDLLSISTAKKGKFDKIAVGGNSVAFIPTSFVCAAIKMENVSVALPRNLKNLFRTMTMTCPDLEKISEISLYSLGFCAAHMLSKKICCFLKMCGNILSDSSIYSVGVTRLKTILELCNKLKLDFDESEECVVYNSIRNTFSSMVSGQDKAMFETILQDVFPDISSPSLVACDILDLIGETCHDENLQTNDEYTRKIYETYELINRGCKILIVGDAWTGKTQLLKICQVMVNKLKATNVVCHYINPGYLDYVSLYGSLDLTSQRWSDGLVPKLFRQLASNGEQNVNWLIFDGNLDTSYVDNMNPLLSDKRFYLESGETLILDHNITVIFETKDLNHFSPSLLSRCPVVYLDKYILGWAPLMKTWVNSCSSDWIQGQQELIYDICCWFVHPCLSFIEKNCSKIFSLDEISLAKDTVLITQIILDEVFSTINRKEEDARNFPSWIQAALLQAGMFALGSVLDVSSKHKFDEFYKILWRGQNRSHPYPPRFEKLEVSLPHEGYLFDYQYIYRQRGTWKLYQDLLKTEKIVENPYMNEFLVPTVDSLRTSYLLNLFVKYKYPMILVGPAGTGKTLLIEDKLIKQVNSEQVVFCHLNMHLNLSPHMLQNFVLSKLNKGENGCFSPPLNKNFLTFIDNLNLVSPGTDESLGCLELLRQHLDHKVWYNPKSSNEIRIKNMNILSAMGLVEGSKKALCQRFLRHFTVTGINEFSDDTIMRIYGNSLVHIWRKKNFPGDVVTIASQISEATYNIFKHIRQQCKPSLSRCYYIFNLCSFSKVIQGCSLLRKESYDSNKRIHLKLWAHELMRVFGDKLDCLDRSWMSGKIKEAFMECFNEPLEDIFENKEEELSQLMFSTITDRENCTNKRYEEVTDWKYVTDLITDCLEKYDYDHKRELKITLFRYALEKFILICRILSLNPGNAILLGQNGTGRQTITKLASYLHKYKLFQPNITQDFGLSNFNDHIKLAAKESGAMENPCVLLIGEEHLLEEVFLQTIDGLLRNGEIPGLYNTDERQEILELARLSAQGGNRNIDISSTAVFLHFNKRCKENLHIILCLSPLGSLRRKRIGDYPALMSCHLIFWTDWPDESFQCIGESWMANSNLPDETKQRVIDAGVYFHRYSQALTKQNLNRNQLNVSVSSTSFVNLINLFRDLLAKKQSEIVMKKNKYEQGLAKLSYAAIQISNMQKALALYQPQLDEMTRRAAEMTDQIALETVEVEKASALVRKDEKIASEQAIVAQRLKSECESELALAIPILEDAISALNTLKPSDITLVKSMKNPPDAIKLVMAAVCVIKDVKPDRIPDPSTGRKIIDYWSPSKRILGDMNFLQTLKDFDKDHIKPELMVKIRKEYLPHKDFTPHIVAKASSAAEGLCKWIIAMDMYDKVAKEVAPKKEKLEKAEREYSQTMEVLNQKKEEVARIEAKLADLNAMLGDAIKKQQKLQKEVDRCNKKLSSAQKLIGSLGGERERWSEAVGNLDNQMFLLPGNILLSSGIIAYLSWLDAEGRNQVVTEWETYFSQINLTFSEDFGILKSLSSEDKNEYWLKKGLPLHDFFLENGIIYEFSKMCSVFVDPEYLAKTWIQNIEKRNNLAITKFTHGDYLTKLSECMVNGKPLLIQEVKEDIPPFLGPLLKREVFTVGDGIYVYLNNKTFKWDSNFRLYIVSNLKYPEYTPEVCEKVTIINFSITSEGLKEKLLRIVTEIEKPELRRLRDELYKKKNKNRTELAVLEAKILRTLCESDTDILEDEASIKILDKSKDLAKLVREKQLESKQIEMAIDEFRNLYRSVSEYSANLYFCTSKLSVLNYVYQCNLDHFVDIYYKSIMESARSRSVENRCKNITSGFTYSLYSCISQFLFERDKLTYLILIFLGIQLNKKIITHEEVIFFLNINRDYQTKVPNPAEHWLRDDAWAMLNHLKEFDSFCELPNKFLNTIPYWKNVFDSSDSLWDHLKSNQELTPFQKLIMVKVIKPGDLRYYLNRLIEEEFGEQFLQDSEFNLSTCYNKSHSLSPILFISTAASNPLEIVSCLARKKKVHHTFRHLSFGVEGSSRAIRMFDEAQKMGSWLLLENCHLSPRWFEVLEQKMTEMDFDNTHENFRLWLTSDGTENIPLELLQNSLKVVDDRPRGLKANLVRCYNRQPICDPNFFSGCPGRQEIFTKLLFGICIFHNGLVDQQTTGCANWKTPYTYDESDLITAMSQLRLIINETNFTKENLKKLHHIIGGCHYAGYLDNFWDIRFVQTLLEDFLNKSMIDTKNYLFNEVECYGLPRKLDYKNYLKYISDLPNSDNPCIFGTSQFTFNILMAKDFEHILSSALRTFEIRQLIDISSHEFSLLTLIEDLLAKLPTPLKLGSQTNYVIQREINTYNTILQTLSDTLKILKDSVCGNKIISSNYTEMAENILYGVVPKIWRMYYFPSRHNLSVFVENLVERITFFKTLKTNGNTFWLGAFFYPKSLIFNAKLEYFRRFNNILVENNTLDFKFIDENDSTPANNVLVITGLKMFGAKWDAEDQKIMENVHSCYHELPPVGLCHNSRVDERDSSIYECPVYQNSDCLNFVHSVFLFTDIHVKHWIKRGVKMVCQNDE